MCQKLFNICVEPAKHLFDCIYCAIRPSKKKFRNIALSALGPLSSRAYRVLFADHPRWKYRGLEGDLYSMSRVSMSFASAHEMASPRRPNIRPVANACTRGPLAVRRSSMTYSFSKPVFGWLEAAAAAAADSMEHAENTRRYLNSTSKLTTL